MTNERNRIKWIAAGTAGVLLAAAGGVQMGRTLLAPGAEAGAAPDAGGEDTHDDEGFVAIDAARARAAGIVTEGAVAGGLGAEIIAQARVAATPDGEAVLAARADGTVVRIDRRLGDRVRAGDVVATMESREAASLAAERSAAAARLALARSAYSREKRLFDARVTARQDLEGATAALAEAEAEARRADVAAASSKLSGDGRRLAVVSLISGQVTRADARLGAHVTAGTELFRISDPERIEVHAAVPAPDARRVRPGDRAAIELPGGAVLPATVRSATPGLDPDSRSITIVLHPEGSAPLAPGQALRVRIAPRTGAATTTIALPEEAVQTIEGRETVFVRSAKGFRATPVTTGQRSAGRIEIVAGLKPGALVATRGAFLLKAEIGKGEAEH